MVTPPHEDMPSIETESCDLGGCHRPWAWECDDERNGPRPLRLCEEHADIWLEMGASGARRVA